MSPLGQKIETVLQEPAVDATGQISVPEQEMKGVEAEEEKTEEGWAAEDDEKFTGQHCVMPAA